MKQILAAVTAGFTSEAGSLKRGSMPSLSLLLWFQRLLISQVQTCGVNRVNWLGGGGILLVLAQYFHV